MELPTRDQIRAVYHLGPDAVIALTETLCGVIRSHEQRIKHLGDIIAKDSHNSSKPPSSDKPKKASRKVVNSRTKSGKKPGGQPGHPGSTLQKVDTPDHTISYHCEGSCDACGRDLANQAVVDTEKHQVFDIPVPKIEVTEHQADVVRCACGAIHTALFPESAANEVQYGPNVKAYSTYLMNYQLLPYERTKQLFTDLFGISISQGTLFSINQRAATLLEATSSSIHTTLSHAPVVHFDESGLYINGDRQWLHVAGTPDLTYYAVHASRGRKAMDEIGILPEYKGRAIHDHYASYLGYECDHGLCNSHHLRELIFVHERHEQPWANELKKHLLYIKDAVECAQAKGETSLSAIELERFKSKYLKLIEVGFKANPPPPKSGKKGRTAQGKPRNLLTRFNDFADETLAFMYDFEVPFDNNLAERDIRMIKLQQKISGCFRSESGAETFCRIRSYISTIKKQGKNILEALANVFAVNNPQVCLLPAE